MTLQRCVSGYFVAGVTKSIPLTLASIIRSRYLKSSRPMPNYMRRRSNQFLFTELLAFLYNFEVVVSAKISFEAHEKAWPRFSNFYCNVANSIHSISNIYVISSFADQLKYTFLLQHKCKKKIIQYFKHKDTIINATILNHFKLKNKIKIWLPKRYTFIRKYVHKNIIYKKKI